MEINISEGVYKYLCDNYGGDTEDDEWYVDENGEYWFTGEWEDYRLTETDAGIFTISSRPSQSGVLVGYRIP